MDKQNIKCVRCLFIERRSYRDPMFNAPADFQQRTGELILLVAQTVRWERRRKLKKKHQRDSF